MIREGILVFGGHCYGHHLHVLSAIALAQSRGMNVIIVEPERKGPTPEEMVMALKTNCSFLHDKLEEQLFIPKESAYDRRNRGQKWYRRFEKRRK